MTHPNHNKTVVPPQVAILAYNNLATFEFSCAVELFALPRADIQNWYQTDIIAVESGLLSAVGGFKIECDHVFSSRKGFVDYDMLIIPGWNGVDNNRNVPKNLRKAIIQFYVSGGRVVSFCSGAFALAATGLLNGKTATTHWLYQSDFKLQFPSIEFKENVLFTEEDRIYTAAGSASGLDLGLYLIGKDYGVSIANKIAKRLVIAPQRQGGQSQFSSKSEVCKTSNYLDKTIEWALENLHQKFTINDMAHNACVSRRSFDRHFRSNFGLSPKEWLIMQRLNQAREYLESSTSSIDFIADKCGFGSAMNMRHHFSKVLGVSPTYYKRQFLQD